MAKRIGFWQKKRGDRRNWSPLAGSVGEAIVFASLLLVAFFALTALLASRFTDVDAVASVAEGSKFWIALLVLSTMAITGTIGLIWTVFSVSTSTERRRAIVDRAKVVRKPESPGPSEEDFPTIPPSESLYDSPGTQLAYRLPQRSGPTWSLVGLALFCLLWLGALAILLVLVTNSFFAGQPRWWLLVFTFLVAAATVRVIQSFIVRLRQTIRIGPTQVEISDLPLYPGQRYEVAIFQVGRMRLGRLRLALVCEEHAAYREGTNLRKEVHRLLDHELLDKHSIEISPSAPFSHACEFVLPPDAMHSFQSESNSIRWSVVLDGEVIRGPKFQREFPLLVYPRCTTP